MKKTFLVFIFLLNLMLLNYPSSYAITIGFDPVSQNVILGNPTNVNLVVSGLGNYATPSLSAFDLNITYDITKLDFTSYTLGPYLGNISLREAWEWSLGETTPGLINLVEVSLLSVSDLNALQPSSFILASLTFDTLALGTSLLGLSITALGDAYGNSFSFVGIPSGSVNVVTSVPEPATVLLIGSGLAGLAVVGYIYRRMLEKCY